MLILHGVINVLAFQPVKLRWFRISGHSMFLFYYRLPENLKRNRYTDVLCLEETRVKLSDLNGDTVSLNLCTSILSRRSRNSRSQLQFISLVY